MNGVPYLSIAVALFAGAFPLHAQNWVPKRIVAITDYPRFAWITHTTGDVAIRCLLDKEGTVVKADVASGPPILGEQAVQNAALWRFRRTSSRHAVKGESVTITYQYRLEGGPRDSPHSSFSVDLPNVVHIVAPLPVPMID